MKTRTTRSAFKQNDRRNDDGHKLTSTKRSKKNVIVKEVVIEDDEADTGTKTYVLDDVEYDSYADFVAAKRQRNEERLKALGFLDGSATKFLTEQSKRGAASSATVTQRGIKRVKTAAPLRTEDIRKSSRLSGSKTQLISLDYYVNDWNRDNSAIVREPGDGGDDDVHEEEAVDKFFKDRVNDGSDLSLEQAIEMNGPKWNRDNSLPQAQALMKDLLAQGSGMKARGSPKKKTRSPTSVIAADNLEHAPTTKELKSKIDNLAIDKEEWVAKVTPDRIYYVTTHPSESKLVCCAGDKQGYVGLWDVDVPSTDDSGVSNNHGVTLFRPHSRPISCLQWLNNDNLISASYDGSVRRLNVEKGVFEEVFATYDDSDSTYLEDLGYGLDQGYRFWTQYATVDPRSFGMSNPCLFLSTSVGDVFHVDLRSSRKGMITFHESVSEKKVNSVRYVSAIQQL